MFWLFLANPFQYISVRLAEGLWEPPNNETHIDVSNRLSRHRNHRKFLRTVGKDLALRIHPSHKILEIPISAQEISDRPPFMDFSDAISDAIRSEKFMDTTHKPPSELIMNTLLDQQRAHSGLADLAIVPTFLCELCVAFPRVPQHRGSNKPKQRFSNSATRVCEPRARPAPEPAQAAKWSSWSGSGSAAAAPPGVVSPCPLRARPRARSSAVPKKGENCRTAAGTLVKRQSKVGTG